MEEVMKTICIAPEEVHVQNEEDHEGCTPECFSPEEVRGDDGGDHDSCTGVAPAKVSHLRKYMQRMEVVMIDS